jgi:hypothetical protein
MTMVQKRSPEPLRDVLYRFSLAKEIPDADLLDEFVRLYPDYAETLTDFAVQLVVESKQSKTAEAHVPETLVSPAVSRAMSRFQSALHSAKTGRVLSHTAEATTAPAVTPFANLGREEFRRIAKELQANSHFLCLVRDGMIVFITMSPGFLLALAAAGRGSLNDVADYLRTRKPVVAAGQFCKADDKPQAGTQITFEEAVKRSGLTPEQQKFLLSL